MINNVIIFGGHIQALGLVRQAHKMGIRTILIISDAFSVARFSQCVDKVHIVTSYDGILDVLKGYEGKDTLLFPTSDGYIDYIESHYEFLSQHYSLGVPNIGCIHLFADKRKTYQFAEKEGIPHPRSCYPKDLSDIISISENISFPVVVKPSVMYTFHDMFGKKAFLCNTKEMLVSKCMEISKTFPINQLVIQEFLSGGAPSLYSYGTFAVNGEPRAWIMANRIRQNPMDFGNSTTFAVSCYVPEIERISKEILAKTQYTGLAEIEFMYDEASHQYKFLEVNTRAWKWHTLSLGHKFGFFDELIRWINDMDSIFCENMDTVAWAERLTDWAVIAKEVLHKRMKLSHAAKTYRIKKTYGVWSWKDPLPALMYIIMSPILFIKRY